jgi:serine/threonine-protein kinase
MSETVQTIADFLNVVRKSGLVESGRLEQAVAPWADAAAGPVPDALVQSLLDAELLTQWQVDQLRKGKHKGFMLGKYKLLRLLGAGGMSSVYLAEHTALRNKVAIKVLPVKRVEQSSYLERFEREARASARLNHPNIARAFDLDTSGSIHFIVMEYVEGIDLHAKVKDEGPLDIRDAVDYIRQAALGLHHAHEEGLVHRDIKPANLILDKRGTVKILDLGLALASDDEEASLTRAHDEKVLGTADFLAPEQARDSHKADRRSDIYSLGCTLCYLLTKEAPYAKGTLAERIRAHMNEPPPNLLERRGDVPPAIAEIYFRMLEKHLDARQQMAQEIADSLGAWLASMADMG